MIAVAALPVLSVFGVALLGALAWLRRRERLALRDLRGCETRGRLLLDAFAAAVDASRRSSAAVLESMDASLRASDPTIDCVLAFVPAGDDLVSVHAGGVRAEHFLRVRVRRDADGCLPSIAAARGCRAVLERDGRTLIPTDRWALAVPMIDRDCLRGVVYVSSAQASIRMPDAAVAMIERAAAPYAIALEREADRADATRDGLTGLLGPRAFRRLLHDEIARAGANAHRMVSLWFVDTDHFKRVNDELGHRVGDGVLVAMAGLLEAHLRPDLDVGARNGGDEFCALLRHATKGQAIERAQRFCQAVRAHDFGVPVRLTASVGVATFPYDASGSNELLETADAAMYHSKRSGRDGVSFACEPRTYARL